MVILRHFFVCEPKERNLGGRTDFITKLKSSDCEPKESNSGGGADFLTQLKSFDKFNNFIKFNTNLILVLDITK